MASPRSQSPTSSITGITLRTSPSPPPSIASTSTLASNSSKPTNTVAVTCIPRTFFHPQILDLLHRHFGAYGAIDTWVPLQGFGRILVVYEAEEAAELAKRYSDPIVVSHEGADITLRVFRADPNPTSHSEMSFLQPPALEKNFLISPPGSPPVGWEPIKEDPPNAAPLADDLIAALERLHAHERRREDSVEVLLDPEEGAAGVGVYVENCDPIDDEDDEMREAKWIYGQTSPARDRWTPIPTALPPMRSAIVV